MDPTRKRRRANSDGDAVPAAAGPIAPADTLPAAPQYDLAECIQTLNDADAGTLTSRILLAAAEKYPNVANLIFASYNHHIEREKNKDINFDGHSKDVWYMINKQYSPMSGSKLYDISFDVYSSITETLLSISHACPKHASFRTKSSGLETLRKIGKTICLSSNDTLGHEVQKHFSHCSTYVDNMRLIVEAMSDEECQRMCDVNDGCSKFLVKMDELLNLSYEYGVFEGLDKVIAILVGDVVDDDDEEEEDEFEDMSGLPPAVSDDEEGEEEEDVNEAESDDEEADGDESEEEDVYKKISDDGFKWPSGREVLNYMELFDENGAPRSDSRSLRLLEEYERMEFLQPRH